MSTLIFTFTLKENTKQMGAKTERMDLHNIENNFYINNAYKVRWFFIQERSGSFQIFLCLLRHYLTSFGQRQVLILLFIDDFCFVELVSMITIYE